MTIGYFKFLEIFTQNVMFEDNLKGLYILIHIVLHDNLCLVAPYYI